MALELRGVPAPLAKGEKTYGAKSLSVYSVFTIPQLIAKKHIAHCGAKCVFTIIIPQHIFPRTGLLLQAASVASQQQLATSVAAALGAGDWDWDWIITRMKDDKLAGI